LKDVLKLINIYLPIEKCSYYNYNIDNPIKVFKSCYNKDYTISLLGITSYKCYSDIGNIYISDVELNSEFSNNKNCYIIKFETIEKIESLEKMFNKKLNKIICVNEGSLYGIELIAILMKGIYIDDVPD
jgi:hypothetical protein